MPLPLTIPLADLITIGDEPVSMVIVAEWDHSPGGSSTRRMMIGTMAVEGEGSGRSLIRRSRGRSKE